MKIIYLLAIALFAMPSVMAADITCNAGDPPLPEAPTFTVSEGDTVTLTFTPDVDISKIEGILWTSDPAIDSQLDRTEEASQTITFIAPAVPDGSDCDPDDGDPVDATNLFDLNVYVETNLLDTPGECIDNDCIRFIVCPRPCPTYTDADDCWNTYTGATYEDSATYPTGTTFLWTITETTSPLPTGADAFTTITRDTKSMTLTKAELDAAGGEPTAAYPERCFNVAYKATSSAASGSIVLLDCNDVTDFCVVYKPEVTVSKVP